MLFLNKMVQHQTIAALLIYMVVSVQTACFPNQQLALMQSIIFGILMSVYFSLTTNKLQLLMPGFLQLAYLFKANEDISYIVFTQSLFLGLFYFSGIFYYFQKLVSRFASISLKIMVCVLIMETLATQKLTIISFHLVDFVFLFLIVVFLVFSLLGKRGKNQKLAICFAFILLIIWKTLIKSTKNTNSFYFIEIFKLQPFFSGNFSLKKITSKILIKGFFLSILSLLENSISIKSNSIKNNKDEFKHFSFQIIITNFLFSLFGMMPMSVSLFGNNFMTNSKKINEHVLFLLILLKLIIANFLFSFILPFEFSTLLIAFFIISKFFINLTAEKSHKLAFKDSKLNHFGLLLLLVIFWASKNKTLALLFCVLSEFLFYLIRINKILGFAKHRNFSEFTNSKLNFEESIVYKIEGGFNFLFINKHFKKIIDLEENGVIVDLRGVAKGFDSEFLESYRELATKLSEIKLKKIEIYGLESVMISKEDETIKNENKIKRI